jgi:hypothetical protein
MAAPKRNTNAKKWTESKVRLLLKDIEKIARRDKALFLGKTLEKLGLYRDVWSYWMRKFADNEDLMDEMDLIKTQFEVNVFKAALKGEIPARIGILTLRNAHGWRNNPARETEDARIVHMTKEIRLHQEERRARAA